MDRLPAALEVAALRRKTESTGGRATVLQKGDERAGILLLLVAERGRPRFILERQFRPDGGYGWDRAGPGEGAEEREFSAYFAQRRRIDPDLWALELDVADATSLRDELAADS